MLLLILALSILPNLLIGSFMYYRLDSILRARAEELASQFMKQSVAYLDMYLDQVAQLNAAVTANPEVQDVLSRPGFAGGYEMLAPFRRLSTAIESLATTRSDIGQWNVYGLNGLGYSTGVPRFDARARMRSTSWYDSLTSRGTTEVWTYAENDRSLVHVRRIHDLETGDVLGYSTLHLPVYHIESVARSFDRGMDATLLLLSARAPETGAATPTPGEQVEVESRILDTDLRLVMRLPVNRLLAGIANLRWYALAIFALLAAVTVAVWLRFARTITTPIMELAHTMNRFREDATGVEAKVQTNDEIGELARTYNAMLRRLNTLVDTIYREQVHRRDAEWAALQAQINPHFLNNTFNSIAAIARAREVPEIVKMVTALSRLFFDVLHSEGPRVPLKKELEFVEHYLRIQRIRFEDRLSSVVQVEEHAEDVLVPRFILQPLVENAIVHGIEPKPAGGTVRVRAQLADTLIILVEDDGTGMPKEKAQALLLGREGRANRIGIWNVQQRIRSMEGAEYGLDIRTERGRGTTVTVSLPRRDAARKVDTA
jgi:two-component system sensor histidine kinase YesM